MWPHRDTGQRQALDHDRRAGIKTHAAMVMNHGMAGGIFIIGSMVAMRCFGMTAYVGRSKDSTVGQSVVRHRRRFYAAKCQSNRQPKQKKHTHHHRRNTEKGLIKQSRSCDVTNLVPAGATLPPDPQVSASAQTRLHWIARHCQSKCTCW